MELNSLKSYRFKRTKTSEIWEACSHVERKLGILVFVGFDVGNMSQPVPHHLRGTTEKFVADRMAKRLKSSL